MDAFEKAMVLMNKWNGDEGATNEELIELRECLKEVHTQLESALEDRLSERRDGDGDSR
jgi:hypothetical protein